MALTWVAEWVVRYRRFAVLLTYVVGAAGRETRELLCDPEIMSRVKAGVPLAREMVGLPDRFNALLGPRGWAGPHRRPGGRACAEADSEVSTMPSTAGEPVRSVSIRLFVEHSHPAVW
ncbi:MAG: hypothetical protein M3P51_03115 [Chloroflexota bacterium]|nr:hypothetical protein [Chloroflexota bacterium]